MSTTEKLAQALRDLLHECGFGRIITDTTASRNAEAVLTDYEADKQPIEDERGAFEAWRDSEWGTNWHAVHTVFEEEMAWTGWQARAGRASAQAVPAWRELCRRLYVELFHCDQQMLQVKKYGRPVFSQGKTVRDVLADAKAALAAAPKGD